MLTSNENAVGRSREAVSNAKWDLRSERPHSSNIGRKDRIEQVDFPKMFATNCNQISHYRESSLDSQQSDEGYDK